MMEKVILSLGSNLGDRLEYLTQIKQRLQRILLDPIRESLIFECEAVGVIGKQPDYLNQVISGFFDGEPAALLKQCLDIEIELGRIRTSFKGARTADIDILFFNDRIVHTDTLVIPHPAIRQRRFLLEALNNCESQFRDPSSGNTCQELLVAMDAGVREQKIWLFKE